jgi:hypothetical protein
MQLVQGRLILTLGSGAIHNFRGVVIKCDGGVIA